jgi:carbamoyltransferase
MKIIGISPLDKDSTVCLLEDGKIIAAVAEERFSRQKMHVGFPYLALQHLFERYKLKPEEVDQVTYAFFDAKRETQLMAQSKSEHNAKKGAFDCSEIFAKFRGLPEKNHKMYDIPSLPKDKLVMKKPIHHETFYTLASKMDFFGKTVAMKSYDKWVEAASADHYKFEKELLEGIEKFGLKDKLKRFDHHLTHSANAYYTSGFDDALIVTIDGYGSGLAGSIATGRGGQIKRLHGLSYPASLGEFYERVTSSLGFKPSRHEGKIVGLAAYGDPDLLFDSVHSYFKVSDGDILYKLPHNIFFTRYLACRFTKPDIAAAYQRVLERVLCDYVAYYVRKTGLKTVVLSGGVFANVKANQRVFEIEGVEKIYVHPNMGDGGCCVGAALLPFAQGNGLKPFRIDHVYWGPDYTEKEIEESLRKAGLQFEKPANLEMKIAELLINGNIVARFDGRMEYGPRALGNRSILYHAKDPSVNLWLNKQLKRTEFMPFAPVTLHEERHKCYKNIDGAEFPAEYMTITFDCTEFMRKQCPAAVHVDGTARPQLIRREINPGYYQIVKEYYSLTGNPSVINTSFNMHEEPIVCTPDDAIRAFMLGHLHYLAIGPFLVKGQAEGVSA